MDLYFLLSLLIAPAALIGLVRFNVSDKAYRPFLYYVFISLLNEIIIYCLPAHPKQYQLADLNLFALLEYVFLLYQFYEWNLFQRFSWIFYLLLSAFVLLWLFENVWSSNIITYNPWFILLHCFIIVLLSINVINRVVTDVFEPIYKNARFIISIGLIIFFTYYMILSAMFLISNKTMALHFFRIQVYINILANLLFAAGVYFIPKRPKELGFFDGEDR